VDSNDNAIHLDGIILRRRDGSIQRARPHATVIMQTRRIRLRSPLGGAASNRSAIFAISALIVVSVSFVSSWLLWFVIFVAASRRPQDRCGSATHHTKTKTGLEDAGGGPLQIDVGQAGGRCGGLGGRVAVVAVAVSVG
jgi:hypothetical protein